MTIILIAGVGSLWYLELFYGMPVPSEIENYISDKSSLNSFMETEEKAARESMIREFDYVPIGILVQSIKILGINEAQVSGIIWQRIQRDLIGEINEGFNFPASSNMRTNEMYRTTDRNGNLTIGWSFQTVVRQNFENKLFPFEQLNLQLAVSQKNLLDRIQFIPDLSAYDDYAVSSIPFVAEDIIVPSWVVKQSYFTVSRNEFLTDFGQTDASVRSNNRDLVLNITMQRSFLSNFFANFLPFFVLLLLSFIAVLFSTGIADKSKILAFKPTNIQGIASGFILFLVFSIANIRRSAISNHILYIEYLYFFTFFVLLGLVYSVTHICTQRKSILGYQDGLFVKTLYWPFVLNAIFYITYYIFITN